MTTTHNKTNNSTFKSSHGFTPASNIKTPSLFLPKGSFLNLDEDSFYKNKDKSIDALSTNTSEGTQKGEDKPLISSEDQEGRKTPIRNQHKRSVDDGTSDNSENSPNISGKFVKVRLGGVKDTQPLKPWEDDINYLFSQDKSKFIGEFHTEEYKIIRGYLQGSSFHLRLYYTKVEPFKKKVATMCIVHGLGGHSGRFMEVTYSLIIALTHCIRWLISLLKKVLLSI